MQGGGDEEAQKDIIVVYPESKAYTTQKGWYTLTFNIIRLDRFIPSFGKS
jgi:hypothetical protein